MPQKYELHTMERTRENTNTVHISSPVYVYDSMCIFDICFSALRSFFVASIEL